MAIFEIPISDSPDVVFTTLLDGVSYDIRLHWNGRDQAWYMYLGRQNQQYIFKTKVTTATDLLAPYRSYANAPKGFLVAIDNIKSYGRITRNGWSSGRWKLYYLTADEYVDYLQALKDTEQLQITTLVEDDNRFVKSEERL